MKFSELNFQNHFEKLGDGFYKKANPTPLSEQRVVAYSKAACDLINLDHDEVKSENFLAAISGKTIPPKFCNLAQAYAGHQFGHLVPQLGDGRAVLLAQVLNQKNESWDLALKGSGLTPFSRPYVQNADGRAVLRSSIREFLISEAMSALGIPTSRALCLIASDEIVIRETPETAAQIIRMAPSHVRFGTFEFFFYRKENEKIKILADYVMAQNFPQAKNYSDFLASVVESTAKMISKWQAFGFCHGVLNTDNMSILGITFDYGPFGFLDQFNPQHICNHSDQQGRYSFANQPTVGFWNLHAFAVTLSSLVSMEEQQEILGNYEKIFLDEYHALMAAKLGFDKVDAEVKKMIYDCLHLLEKHKMDYTNFFRGLSPAIILDAQRRGSLEFLFEEEGSTRDPRRYASRMTTGEATEEDARQKLMNRVNPKFILRNHLLQIAIEKAEGGDFSEVKKLQKIFERPFEEQEGNEDYAGNPPAWAGELCISCSS